MRQARERTALATAALLLVVVTSCANDATDPPDTAGPSSASTTPSAPSSTPPSESDSAATSAVALVEQFYDVRNQLRQDSKQSLKLLKTVAISSELAAQQTLFRTERKQGLHQTGETKIAELQVQSVNLDDSDPQAGRVPTVQVDVCFDVSAVDLLDRGGKSVVSSDRPDTGWIRYSVANYDWDLDPTNAWRVASSQDIERAPCSPL